MPDKIVLSQQNLGRVRDLAITKAVAERRIPEDRRGHYEMAFSRDPEGTLATLARLEQAPACALAPSSLDLTALEADEAYPQTWLSQAERGVIRAAQEDRDLPSRVVVEQ